MSVVATSLKHHLGAAGLAGVAALLRAIVGLFDPAVVPFAFFYPAVLLATLLWTTGAGITALLVSTLAGALFVAGMGQSASAIVLNVCLFVVTGGLMVLVAHRLQRALRRLEASDARLALLHRTARVGEWHLDLPTDRLHWSANLYALLGLDPAGFTPSRAAMEALIDPADRPAYRHLFAEARAGRDGLEAIFRLQRPDGVVRWITTRAEVRRDGAGKAVRIDGLDIDITERMEAEHALAESRARTGRLFEAMTEGFIVGEIVRADDGHPADCRLIDANPAAARLLGRTPAAVAGRRLADLLGGVSPEWLAFVDRVVATGEPERMEGWSNTFRAWLEVYAYRIDGDRFAVLVSDVSGRKTADLAREDALRQTEALFLEMNHRVKNNLQMISSLLLLQARAAGDPRVRDQLDRARNRIATIAGLHAALYRSERLGLVDFAAYAADIVAAIEETLPGTPAVTVTLSAEPVPVRPDVAVPLGLIINELVTNAAKHAFAGRATGTVEVRFERVAGGLHLRIRDDGTGLPPAGETTGGLGMTLVDGFVQKVGGRLAVSSDDGACFDMVIPDEGERPDRPAGDGRRGAAPATAGDTPG